MPPVMSCRSRFLSLGLLSGALVGVLPAQESKALLHAPVAVLPVDSAPFQKLGDFDGDGDLDAVGSRIDAAGTSSELVVWENNQGVFTVAYTSNAFVGLSSGHQTPSFAITTADFNQDGRMDFAMGTRHSAARYMSVPNFQFSVTSTPLVSTATGARAVATGDFDGDGVINMAVARTDATTGVAAVDVFLAGWVTLSVTIPSATFSDLRLMSADLDASPGQELMLSNPVSNQAYLITVSAGTIQIVNTLSTALAGAGGPWLWTAGDLDQDGDEDIVVFKPGAGSIAHRYQVFRAGPVGTFTAEPIDIGGPAEYLADIDGDGDLDGVCCGGGTGGGGNPPIWPLLNFPSTFELSENLGGGDFAPAWHFAGAGSRSMAGAADVDGDGDIDLVAGRCIYFGDGPWDKDPQPEAVGATGTMLARPWQLHDQDGDGDIDIDLGVHFRNRGDGEFVEVAPVLNGPAGYSVVAPTPCDVDGDGFADQLVNLYTTTTPAQFVSMAWFRNNGGGAFAYVGTCGAVGMVIGPAVSVDRCLAADCDGDGDQDMIARSQPAAGVPGTSQVFWNNNGTFVPGPSFGTNSGRIDSVADFNGDGHPDLLMTGVANGVNVHTGTGPGQTFQLAWSRGWLPIEPGAVAVGDVNDDGAVDFVRPDNTGALLLFVNKTPQGTFGFAEVALSGISVVLPSWQPASARPAVAIADVDADGLTDIVCGSLAGEPNVCAVLRRHSGSTTLSMANFEVIKQAMLPGYAADADADGVPDVVGSRAVRSRHFSRHEAGRNLQLHGGLVVGEAGTSPLLGAIGPFRVPYIAEYRLRSVPGPTLAVLGLSLGEASVPNVPFPGMSLLLDSATLLVASWPVTENGDGRAAASASMAVPLIHGLQGFRFYAQAFVLDPAAPHGLTQSNLMIQDIGS